MHRFVSNLKTKIGGTFSSILSAISAGGGTTSAICQTTCTVSPTAASLFGLSLAFSPLAVLFKFHVLLWWIALSFLFLLIISHLSEVKRSKLDQILILINSGFIVMGFPYSSAQNKESFLILGLTISAIGALMAVRYKIIKT